MDFGPKPMNQKKSKTWLLTLVIIIVLAAIAYFVYYVRTSTKAPAEPIVNQLESQGTSDNISDIEKDLNNTALDKLDTEVSDIDKELGNTSI